APAARGLFHKAIVESAGGGWGPPTSRAMAMTAGARIAAAAGLKDASPTPEALRALPAQALADAAREDRDIILDRALLTEPPLAAFAAGRSAAIPMIIGNNGEEGSLLDDDAQPAKVFGNAPPEEISRLSALYKADGVTLARDMFRDGY